MFLEETVNKFIRDTIDLILANPGFSIKAKQYGAPKPPLPNRPFATVDFSFDSNLGWEQKIYENNELDPDLTETVEGLRQVTLSLNFLGSGSVDNARKVRTALTRENIIGLFNVAQLGLLNRSEIREISEALEDGWEERAQFDLFLSAVGTDADIVRSILTIDISGEFQTRGLVHNISSEI